jgi:hypothetical protein
MGLINTSSGGLVETLLSQNRFSGTQLYLHIDQSTNVNNGEGDAAIVLTTNEVKDLIFLLNDFITYMEGKPHVVLADPLLREEVRIMVGDKEIKKNPELINPYLAIEDIITPGEYGIDYDDYLGSIQDRIVTTDIIIEETPIADTKNKK